MNKNKDMVTYMSKIQWYYHDTVIHDTTMFKIPWYIF